MRFKFTMEETNNSIDPKFENLTQIKNKDLFASYMVEASNKQSNHCIGVVDLANSTKILAKIGQKKAPRYIQFFLNSMAKIVNQFGGVVVKNVGDCLLYCFPESTSDPKQSFVNCLECSLTMTEVHDELNIMLQNEGLPMTAYRVSADYGAVTLMRASNTITDDLIGYPVNICHKINRLTLPNSVVIGNEFFQAVQNLKGYKFESLTGCCIKPNDIYPVYLLTRNKNKIDGFK